MAIAVRTIATAVGNDGSATTIAITTPSVNAGELVSVYVAVGDTANNSTCSLNDGSNTYGTQWLRNNNATMQETGYWFDCIAVGTGALTITATFDTSRPFRRMQAFIVTGQGGTYRDTTATNGGTSNAPNVSITTGADNALVIASAQDASIPGTNQIGGSTATDGGSTIDQRWEYLVVGAAGSKACTFTLGGSQDWMASAVSYLPPGGPSQEQEGFRFVNDDGNEAGSTFHAAQDTNISDVGTEAAIRLRMIVNATNDPAAAQYCLEYRKTGETPWNKVDKPL